MRKLMVFVMPLKGFAAMIFAGSICLYMIGSVLYAVVMGDEFNYAIPFIFVLQGLGLSILISILWGVFFSNVVIKRWRFFLRHIVFVLSLLALLTICFLTFLTIPTDWSKLWLITVAILAIGITLISILCEMYFRKTGRRYTEILKTYKESIL